MAFAEFNFYSKSLQMDVQVSLILPEKVQGVGSAPAIRYGNFPVLYLLHGTSGDHTDWERWTSIERYAAKKGLAVVMPAAQLSAYTNMVHGERYFDYIAYELPEKISKLLPISCCREDTYLCGLSMGGYGALKIGLTLPENYAAIGTLSNGNHAYMAAGKVGSDMEKLFQSPLGEAMRNRFQLCWGWTPEHPVPVVGTYQDIFWLAKKNLYEKIKLPDIFAACGKEDHNYSMASDVRKYFEGLPGNPYRYQYQEEHGGHTWEFWDKWIQVFLDWLPMKGEESPHEY